MGKQEKSLKQAKRAAAWAACGIGSAAAVYTAWQIIARAKLARENNGLARGKKIVILGGGFAGVYVARELARLLPGSDDGAIILIDQHPFLLFTPMLTEAVGGEIDGRHIVSPVTDYPARITFMPGRIDSVDLPSKTVTLTVSAIGASSIGEPLKTQTIAADQLVIALGAVSNYHGIPGLADQSVGIKSIVEAERIYQTAITLLDQASRETDDAKRSAMLTFVVGGGGYTGVETLAALNSLLRERVRRYPSIPEKEIRTVLIEPEERILKELSPELAGYAQRKLIGNGIEVRLNTSVAGAGDGFVELKGGERISTRTLIWAAGIMPNPIAANLDCAHDKHGAIEVEATCAVNDHPGVWALGDCAAIPQAEGKTYAPTAQNATREGSHVAQNIVATLRGHVPRPFVYTPIGELALIGKQDGVALVYGHKISGVLAWAMWRAVYLAKMPGIAQRIRILLDWTLDFTLGRPSAPPRSNF